MPQDNTDKKCLPIKPEVRDQGQNNSVSVKVMCCRNPLKSSSCTWPTLALEKHSTRIELLLFIQVSFKTLIAGEFKACFFHIRFEVCKRLQTVLLLNW